ncbi:MAG: hypothetical protein WC144_06755 [Sulfurimonas sp.]|jgi:hypothetical protein
MELQINELTVLNSDYIVAWKLTEISPSREWMYTITTVSGDFTTLKFKSADDAIAWKEGLFKKGKKENK